MELQSLDLMYPFNETWPLMKVFIPLGIKGALYDIKSTNIAANIYLLCKDVVEL